jgi:aminoglycoside phosphotransferase (APT) family kinase protein
MTTMVERNGAFALKMFTDGHAPVAELVLAVTAKLRLAGVPVPETSKDATTGALRQPWIEGPTLRESLIAAGPMRTVKDFTRQRQNIHGVMRALVKLHGAETSASGLRRFDPFRLIDPRLETDLLGTLSSENRKLAGDMRVRLGERLTGFTTSGLIHGDLHAGQVIQDRATGTWWLIDLDDVSIGPPEADIGNFCAHMASTPAINGIDMIGAIKAMTKLCIIAYDGTLEPGAVKAFGAAALVRRALKCAERHGSDKRIFQMLMTAKQLLSSENKNAANNQTERLSVA